MDLWNLAAVACCAGVALSACAAARQCGRQELQPRPISRLWLIGVLLAGLLVRLILAATTTGHPVDTQTFGAWAGHAAENLGGFYSPDYFADYPPGYVYVLWAIGELRQLLGLGFGSPGFLLLLKLPAILADTVAAWLIYRLCARHITQAAGVAIAALYAFNPAVILNSAIWGQVDGVLTLLVLAALLLLEHRPALSAACFAAALLVKPQALIFAPAPLLWFASRAQAPGAD